MEPGVWQSAFTSATAEFLQRLLAYLPNIAAALGLALAGWIAAWLASAVVVRLAGGLLALLGRQATLGRAVERSRLGPGFARLLGRVVFWFVAALFLAAAVERLELTIAASLVSALAAFLPRVLAGLVIVFGGIVGGQVAFSAINRAAGAAGFPQATMRADRESAYAQWDLPLAEALQQEWQRGKARIPDALEGAQRFAAGQGRHGRF